MISVVTGSSGFIGSHLCKRLASLGHGVMKVKHGEIKDLVVKEVDFIWFLSAYGNHSTQTDQDKIYKANVDDLYRLLSMTKGVPYKGFFHFSTSSVLLDHQTPYSTTKKVGESLVSEFAQLYDKPIFSIRPYSVFGGGEADFRFIPTVIKRMYADEIVDYCPGMHDWVYIDDFIDACIMTMDNVHRIKNPVHIGTGIQTDNLGVIDHLTKIINPKQRRLHKLEKMRDYDTTRWVCEDRQLMKMGWQPRP